MIYNQKLYSATTHKFLQQWIVGFLYAQISTCVRKSQYCLRLHRTHRVVGPHGSDCVTSQCRNSKQLRRRFTYGLKTQGIRWRGQNHFETCGMMNKPSLCALILLNLQYLHLTITSYRTIFYFKKLLLPFSKLFDRKCVRLNYWRMFWPFPSSHRAGRPSPYDPLHQCFLLSPCDPRGKPAARLRRSSLRKCRNTQSGERWSDAADSTGTGRSDWPEPTLFLTIDIEPTTFRCFGLSLAKICITRGTRVRVYTATYSTPLNSLQLEYHHYSAL